MQSNLSSGATFLKIDHDNYRKSYTDACRRCHHGRNAPAFHDILNPAALSFLADLHRRYDRSRIELLKRRAVRQNSLQAREWPDFLSETNDIRAADWRIREIPHDLQVRRVEIVGPVDLKTIVKALNSGAKTFIADFEDATSPTFRNIVEGQINLKDRWAGNLDTLKQDPATLIVRPRGWHMPEKHIVVDGAPMAGAFVDFGLYAFHNARTIWKAGATPAFYLPKLESHLEARLWRDVLAYTEFALGLPHGSLKATVLIETLPAAFEMDEILYELRDHIIGLSCGGWDAIFSTIKRVGKHARLLTPDRSAMVMSKAFLHAWSLLLIKTCHRRGAFAMGGMAAQILGKSDTVANEAAFAQVRCEIEREVGDGHDGTWVAHPDLVPVAIEVFDQLMPTPNQLHRLRGDITVRREEMLGVHVGVRTEAGLRENIRSVCNTWSHGCGDEERCRCTTIWKMRRWPRSAARRHGSGCTTERPWMTVGWSPAPWSRSSSPTRWRSFVRRSARTLLTPASSPRPATCSSRCRSTTSARSS